jgi:acetyl esterase
MPSATTARISCSGAVSSSTTRNATGTAGKYLNTEDLVADPRVSVLHDTQLAGLPPTYVATSGFDPLRDEAEAYVHRLRDAGVPVIHRRHEGMLHGFATRVGVDPEARAALQHAARVLRAGLALSGEV